MKGGRGLTMANKPLPENIQKIREIFKAAIDHKCPYEPACILDKAKLSQEECNDCAIEGFISKLDELGVVVLAKDQTPKACPISSEEAADALYNQDNQSYHWARTAYLEAQSDMSDFKRVVSIVTGTPKEG
jgi:hypothetical protein